MKGLFEIRKVNKYYQYGARVTHEKTQKLNATLEEVLEIAKKQKADIEEVVEELETMGVTAFKGYLISEMY